MTNVSFQFCDDGSIVFECKNHSGDHDTCTICSTLCNVLACEVIRHGRAPAIYKEGHVLISGDKSEREVFIAVLETFKALESMTDKVRAHVEGSVMYNTDVS